MKKEIKLIGTNSNINPEVLDAINSNFKLLFELASSGDNESINEKINAINEKLTTVEATANNASSKADSNANKITTVESNYTSLEARVAKLENPA